MVESLFSVVMVVRVGEGGFFLVYLNYFSMQQEEESSFKNPNIVARSCPKKNSVY